MPNFSEYISKMNALEASENQEVLSSFPNKSTTRYPVQTIFPSVSVHSTLVNETMSAQGLEENEIL